MNSNHEPLWKQFAPIKTQPNARFDFNNGQEIYDVALAVEQINTNPDAYQCLPVPLAHLVPQLEGVAASGGVNAEYAALLSWEDATRPLLLGSYATGEVRLLDGYHRLTKLLSEHGSNHVAAWILTPQQTAAIRLI